MITLMTSKQAINKRLLDKS